MRSQVNTAKLHRMITRHAEYKDCTECPAYPNDCRLETIETLKDCEESLRLFLEVEDEPATTD